MVRQKTTPERFDVQQDTDSWYILTRHLGADVLLYLNGPASFPDLPSDAWEFEEARDALREVDYFKQARAAADDPRAFGVACTHLRIIGERRQWRWRYAQEKARAKARGEIPTAATTPTPVLPRVTRTPPAQAERPRRKTTGPVKDPLLGTTCPPPNGWRIAPDGTLVYWGEDVE